MKKVIRGKTHDTCQREKKKVGKTPAPHANTKNRFQHLKEARPIRRPHLELVCGTDQIILTMTSEENSALNKIIYKSPICPHREFVFDDTKGKGRASPFLKHVLGWDCAWKSEKVKHRVLARLEQVDALWLFLHSLKWIWAQRREIPSLHHGDGTSLVKWDEFCRRIDDKLHDRLYQFPAPQVASMRLNVFTQWYLFETLGQEMQAEGYAFPNVLDFYEEWTQTPYLYDKIETLTKKIQQGPPKM